MRLTYIDIQEAVELTFEYGFCGWKPPSPNEECANLLTLDGVLYLYQGKHTLKINWVEGLVAPSFVGIEFPPLLNRP